MPEHAGPGRVDELERALHEARTLPERMQAADALREYLRAQPVGRHRRAWWLVLWLWWRVPRRRS